jgi:hypothetical protein
VEIGGAIETPNFVIRSVRNRRAGHFSRHLDRVLDQCVPAVLKTIICLQDDGSRDIAERAKLRASGAKIVTLGEIRRLLDKGEKIAHPVLVVAAVVMTGRNVLAISQMLRASGGSTALAFVVGLTRTASEEAFRDLRSNLSYGRKPGDYGFHAVENVHLPADRRPSAWTREHELLRQFEPSDSSEHRLRALESGDLVTNAFLPTISGSDMRLRKGFAFLSFEYEEGQITQADAYFVIAGVLHARRRTILGTSTEHVRTLINPWDFDRYNDGVIQAALLRAALPAEIDYSVDVSQSADMCAVVKAVIENAGNPAGEATLEFLLALALGRLKLVPSHAREVISAAKGIEHPLAKAFVSKIPTAQKAG